MLINLNLNKFCSSIKLIIPVQFTSIALSGKIFATLSCDTAAEQMQVWIL